MHLCNFLVLVKRKKRPFTWFVFFLPAHVYPSFSLLKPEISQKLYMIFKLIGVNRFSIYILIWPPVNLYLAPPPPQKTVNLGQWTQMWVGGVGWFYGIFDPFLSKITVNVPNLMKLVKLRGLVGGFTSLGQLSQIYRFFGMVLTPFTSHNVCLQVHLYSCIIKDISKDMLNCWYDICRISLFNSFLKGSIEEARTYDWSIYRSLLDWDWQNCCATFS